MILLLYKIAMQWVVSSIHLFFHILTMWFWITWWPYIGIFTLFLILHFLFLSLLFFCFVNHRNCNKRVLFCTFCSLSRFPTIDHSEPFLSIHDYHVTNPNCSKSISFKTKSPNQKNHFIYISQTKSGLGQWRNSESFGPTGSWIRPFHKLRTYLGVLYST